jgi:plastocyanin
MDGGAEGRLVSSVRNRPLRLVLLMSLAVLAVQLVALPRAAHSSTNWQVTITGDTFDPNYITVNVGDSVTWTNNGGGVHSTVADHGQADTWNSGGISDGNNYTYVFNIIGRFDYFCDIHPAMTGTVVVQQPVPEFPGILVFLTLATAIGAALLMERGLGRRA